MVSVDHSSLLALVWTCFSVALLFVALRTAIRLRVASRPTADDYWITLALAALLTLCALETVQEPSLAPITGIMDGTGVENFNSLIADTEHYLKYQFPIIVLFWTVLWSVKASFLALYFRFFRELKHYRRAWYGLVVFTFLAYVGCIITLTLSCGQPASFFRFAQCGRPEQIWASNLSVYYSTTVDVFTDLCIMAMPLKLIYKLKQISTKQKLGLTCVFGLCFVMIAFSIVRAKQVLVPQHFVNLTLLMTWSTLTASISVIVGSLPAFKIFLTNRASAKRSRYGLSSNRGNKQPNDAMSFRGKEVPLSPLPSVAKSPAARDITMSDSQENMLQGDGPQSGPTCRGISLAL
ncbi:hypothetical protein VUR80DRAFT_1307 [Thermomyces stellatus]